MKNFNEGTFFCNLHFAIYICICNMPQVTIYTTNYCPYCRAAKSLLKAKNIAFDEMNIENDSAKRQWLFKVTGQKTVPQIFINNQSIGGFEELKQLDQEGKLEP